MSSQGTIVAFGAHHDDIEIAAGGTVARYIRMGWDVRYVVAVDAVYVTESYRHEGKPAEALSHDEILAVRNEESRKGAALLGASEPVLFHLKPAYYWTGKTRTRQRVHFHNDDAVIEGMKQYRGRYFSLNAASTPDCVAEVMAFLKKSNAKVVLTQHPCDVHPEHHAVSKLVFAACRKLVSEGMDLNLYAWEPGSAGRMVRFVPDVVVDVTSDFETKLSAIRVFASQVNTDRPGALAEAACSKAAYWGGKIGTTYAEAFAEMLVDDQGGADKTDAHFDYGSTWPGPARVRAELCIAGVAGRGKEEGEKA